MQDCLANTGTNALILQIIAGLILIAGGILVAYAVKTKHKYRYHVGLFSLLTLFGLVSAITLAPATTYAQSTPEQCSQANDVNNGTGLDDDNTQASITCPENWVVVPGNSAYNTTDFCLMKYSAKNVGGTVTDTNDFTDDDDNVIFTSNTYSGGVATSQASGQPWANISQTDAIAAAQTAGSGAHLITENEWMTIAHNVLANPANWCDSDGTGCGNAPGTSGKVLASGHNDGAPNMPLEAPTDDSQACFGTVTPNVNTPCGSEAGTQKRTLTLSNGEVIWDLVGNVGHWTDATETRGNLPSNSASGGAFEYNLDTGFSLPVPDDWGTLAYTSPSIQNPTAANWGVAQGVGLLYSDFSSGSPTVFAFSRGGAWINGPYAGAFSLSLGYTPSDSDAVVGFRSAL